jgi:hypothetical protein
MSHVSAAICVCAPFRRDLIGFHAADLTPEEAAKVTAARPPVVSPQGLLLFVGIFHGMAFGLLEMRATMTLKFNRLDPGFMWSDRVSHQNTLAISLLRASKSSRSTAFCDLHLRMSSCIATFLVFRSVCRPVMCDRSRPAMERSHRIGRKTQHGMPKRQQIVSVSGRGVHHPGSVCLRNLHFCSLDDSAVSRCDFPCRHVRVKACGSPPW